MGIIRDTLTSLRGKTKPHPWHRLEIFPDRAGQWRWRKVSRQNGQIVATSHQAFFSEFNARRGALDGNRDMNLTDVTIIRAQVLDEDTVTTGVPAEPWTPERPTRYGD